MIGPTIFVGAFLFIFYFFYFFFIYTAARDRPLIVVGPGASAQVSPCIKAALRDVTTRLLGWTEEAGVVGEGRRATDKMGGLEG